MPNNNSAHIKIWNLNGIRETKRSERNDVVTYYVFIVIDSSVSNDDDNRCGPAISAETRRHRTASVVNQNKQRSGLNACG